MKNSSINFTRINFCIVFLVTLLLQVGCSKSPGKTSSKIKLFSGNFTTLLATKANNGLIFYGKSTDGKSFTKKVDTDTLDLVFPNGSWNFYAVAYELGGTAPVVPDFTGKTYCGKASAVFNGTDAIVSLDLSNAGCNDPEFSTDTKLVSVDYTLPSVMPFTCKDISGITGINNTACDQNSAAKFNKGYATSYRVVAFEYKNFGVATAPVKIAQSACVRANYSTLTGMLEAADSSLLNSLHVPTTPGKGLTVSLEVFYSPGAANAGCDAALGVDIVPLGDSPRTKVFSDAAVPSTYNVFVKSDAPEVCAGVRLSSTGFAAGFGTVGSPYAICTPGQLDLLRTQFANYKESSFDLLTDINYGMGKIAPIGDQLVTIGTGPTNFYGKSTVTSNPIFDGKNHKISNFMIDCTLSGVTATANNGVGFFRWIKDATVKNLTFNNAVIDCEDGNQVGGLAGVISDSTSLTTIENIKVHGHVDGNLKMGGIAGEVNGSAIIASGLHVKGGAGGSQYVGGLFGNMSMTTGASTISQVSFFGELHGNNHNNNGMAIATYAGGLIGFASSTSSIAINQAIVKAKQIEGSTTVGGFIGESTNVSISDSYVEAVLKTTSYTSGSINGFYANIGGAIGKATGGSLARVLALNGFRSANRDPVNDHSFGGLIGNNTSTADCVTNPSFFTGFHDGYGCGTQMDFSTNNFRTRLNYGTLFPISINAGAWDSVNNTPTLSPGCSPSDAGQYYEVSNSTTTSLFGASVTVLPGDIILCNGSSNSVVQLLNRGTALAPYLWTMPDPGHDFPRLSYESAIENTLPHLKRDCHGLYTTQAGSGTILNPLSICSDAQFEAMIPGHYYELKKNIFYEGLSGTYAPKAAGVYHLNGNGYGLYGYSMTLPNPITGNTNYGIFSYLDTGSTLRNLSIIDADIISATTTSNVASVLNIGILAGQNLGAISNVNIELSKSLLDYTTAYADTINFGGAVGLNGASGLVQKSEINVHTTASGAYALANSVSVGSVIGKNDGVVLGVKSYSGLNRNLNCPGSGVLTFNPLEKLGVFAGVNNGTIREIESNGEFRGEFMTGTCTFEMSGAYSPLVALNNGTIEDFRVEPKVYFKNSSPPKLLELVPEAGPSSVIRRGFVEVDSMNAMSFMHHQTYVDTGAWDAAAAPSAYSSMTPICDSSSAGNFVIITNPSPSTSFGAMMALDDYIICDGASNVLVPAALASRILMPGPTMSDVLFLVRDNGGSCSNLAYTTQATCQTASFIWTLPASLPVGGTCSNTLYPREADCLTAFATWTPSTPSRFYDTALEYFVGAPGLVVKKGGFPLASFSGAGWTVTSNFFYPGANAWMLDLFNGATSSTKTPELVKTEGGLEQLGSGF